MGEIGVFARESYKDQRTQDINNLMSSWVGNNASQKGLDDYIKENYSDVQKEISKAKVKKRMTTPDPEEVENNWQRFERAVKSGFKN